MCACARLPVCACTRTCVCVRVCTSVRLCMHAYMCMCAHVHVCPFVHARVHVYVCACARLPVCACMRTCVCVFACTARAPANSVYRLLTTHAQLNSRVLVRLRWVEACHCIHSEVYGVIYPLVISCRDTSSRGFSQGLTYPPCERYPTVDDDIDT